MKDEKSKGVAASQVDDSRQTTDDGQTAIAAREDGAGDVVGQLSAANLSAEARDLMTRELLEAMHQVQSGFGTLTAPGEIFKLDQVFHVVDAITIPDYVDQTTGEEKVKHIFCLQFADGVARNVMQSDARPRRVLANAFSTARQLGVAIKAGPYKYASKPIPRQMQPALIFEQQAGFAIGPAR